MFLLAINILISMTMNLAFFNDYEECIYRCDHHFPAGVDDPTTPHPACSACPVEEDWETCAMGETAPINESRTCVQEQLPGMTLSLLSTLVALPVMGCLSYLVRTLRTYLAQETSRVPI